MSNNSKLLVSAQFLCFAYFIFSGGIFCEGILLLIQFLGISISVWGMTALKIGNFNIQPEVKVNAKFIRTGPYRWIRNPIYLGLLIFFGANVIGTRDKISLLVFTILLLIFLLKIHLEEKYLASHFGEAYSHYKKNTYRLIPYFF